MKGPSKELPLYQHAAERKVKIFSSKEIRRKFWNEKAEELCQDRTLKKWKATAIHGVIDTAWVLKKTVVLVVEASNTQDREAREEATEHSTMKKQKKETVDANVHRRLCSHRELLRVNERLRSLNDANNTTSQKKKKIAFHWHIVAQAQLKVQLSVTRHCLLRHFGSGRRKTGSRRYVVLIVS